MSDVPRSRGSEFEHWLAGLARDADVFVHRLDIVNRRALLVRLGADRIRAAAFLDERALAGDEPGAWLPLAAAVSARPRNVGPRGIILHCGHTGSTLVTRLLDELPGTRTLREPLALHALATEARLRATPVTRLKAEEFHAALDLTQAAYAKAPAGIEATIVKHTSFTANLGPTLVQQATPPAVFILWTPLEHYLATMLRTADLREGTRLLSAEWIWDLATVLATDCPRLAELQDAEFAALNWVAAQLAFARVASEPGARFLAWRFEEFLAEPRTRLSDLAQFFGLDVDEAAIEQAVSSPWVGRYAKDPRYPFDRRARDREIADARREFHAEITAGIAFAQALFAQLPLAQAPAAQANP